MATVAIPLCRYGNSNVTQLTATKLDNLIFLCALPSTCLFVYDYVVAVVVIIVVYKSTKFRIALLYFIHQQLLLNVYSSRPYVGSAADYKLQKQQLEEQQQKLHKNQSKLPTTV